MKSTSSINPPAMPPSTQNIRGIFLATASALAILCACSHALADGEGGISQRRGGNGGSSTIEGGEKGSDGTGRPQVGTGGLGGTNGYKGNGSDIVGTIIAGSDGQRGGDSGGTWMDPGGGGGGGGGGGNGVAIVDGSALTISDSVTIKGGNGGSGGHSDDFPQLGDNGSSGGGGAGLYFQGSALNLAATVTGGNGGYADDLGNAGNGGGGVVFNGSSLLVSGNVNGGNGGDGYWSSVGRGGSGLTFLGDSLDVSGAITGGRGGNADSGGNGVHPAGDGGTGIIFSGQNINISGTVTGGAGGQGGIPLHSISMGYGDGGVAITAENVAVVNTGTIEGGFDGLGLKQANAITFTGGTSSLTLTATSQINGNVVALQGGSDTLILGGTQDSSFDVSSVGGEAQYQNFSSFLKTNDSTWTLNGSSAEIMPWTITKGVLSVSEDANLGAETGTLTLNGGSLSTNGTFNTGRTLTLAQNAGFNVAANTTLGLTGIVSGSGNLIKDGSGTLRLENTANSYGDTLVKAGELVGNAASISGNIGNAGMITFGADIDSVSVFT